MPGVHPHDDRPIQGSGLVDRLTLGFRRTAEILERTARLALSGRHQAGPDALVRTLNGEHEELLQRFEGLGDPEHEAIGEAWSELREALLAHLHAEDEVLYARLRDEEPTRDAVRHAREEHAAIEALVAAADDTSPGTDAFYERLGVLHQVVLRHVIDEETELLVDAVRLLPVAEREALAERILRREMRLAG